MGWPQSPAEKYGASFVSNSPPPQSPTASVLPNAAGPSHADSRHVLSPSDPLFWALAVGGLAVGLMYASTTVRIGPVRASVSAGSS